RIALEHIKHIICLLVGSFVRSATRGQGGHLIPSVRLRMRTQKRRSASSPISRIQFRRTYKQKKAEATCSGRTVERHQAGKVLHPAPSAKHPYIVVSLDVELKGLTNFESRSCPLESIYPDGQGAARRSTLNGHLRGLSTLVRRNSTYTALASTGITKQEHYR